LATLAKPVDKGKNKNKREKQKKYLSFFTKKETKERKKEDKTFWLITFNSLELKHIS